MINDTQAQKIVGDWHGGGGSALYQFASTGAIVDGLITEIDLNVEEDIAETEREKLRMPWDYCASIGQRGPVDGWYARVICANEAQSHAQLDT